MSNRQAAAKSLKERSKHPFLGCNPVPPGMQFHHYIYPKDPGYVQFVDVEALSEKAEKHSIQIQVCALPGAYVTPIRPLLALSNSLNDEDCQQLLKAFTNSDTRSYEQDPRYGICVLAEIAARALSDGINDHGTAIDVISRLGQVLAIYSRTGDAEARHANVWVPPLDIDDLFDDAFLPLYGDIAGILLIQQRMHKTLNYLASLGNDAYLTNSRRYTRLLLDKMDAKNTLLEEEKDHLRAIALNIMEY